MIKYIFQLFAVVNAFMIEGFIGLVFIFYSLFVFFYINSRKNLNLLQKNQN